MKNNNQSSVRICPNCDFPLPNPNTKYCTNCSQKYTTGPVSFWELISETVSVLFNFDNNFFHTIGAILIPGRLTSQFFKGKQKSYVHPVRVLLVSTVVFIFFLSNFLGNEQSSDLSNSYDFFKRQEWKRKKGFELDSIKQTIIAELDSNQIAINALDTLMHRAKWDSIAGDSFDLSDQFSITNGKRIVIARKDFFELSDLELVDKYNITAWDERLAWRQTIKIIKRGSQLIPYFIGNILWLTILMMPSLALVLKLFYIRHDRYYVEHLVFSMHTHSFVFLVFSGLMLIWSFFETTAILPTLCFLAAYIIIAIKRYYGQSWKKTVLKFSLINAAYGVLLVATSIITVLLSLFLF